MIEIRGQQAADWQDVYEMRTSIPGALPYLRPDWVRDELAKPQDRTWPMVAVLQTAAGPRVVARVNVQFGWARRAHCAYLSFEQHPNYADLPGRQLLQETIRVAEGWWNRRRLQVTVSATDLEAIALFETSGFSQEARLRQGVRIAGELVDEVVLARVTGDAAQPKEQAGPPPAPSQGRREPFDQIVPSAGFAQASPSEAGRTGLKIRGGSIEDWEAYHHIWLQPSVIWGTMQLPHSSADWARDRVQNQQPLRFWPLVAEADDKLVGMLGFRSDERNRAHVGHLGMMVHDDYQGLGIGSALMDAAVDLAENWLGLTRMQLEVYPDNARAIRLYEKFGFEREGLHRAFGYREGHYVDTLVMGRLRQR